MCRHMLQAARYHRFHFRDTSVLPAGKVLEMATVPAATALGMDREIGSRESGKKADVSSSTGGAIAKWPPTRTPRAPNASRSQ